MEIFRCLFFSIFILGCIHIIESKEDIHNAGTELFVKFINNKIALDLPDPLVIESFSQRFNDVILTGTFSGSDLNLTGLSTIVFNLTKIDGIFPVKVNATLTVENLNLYLDYSTDLMVGQLLPFYGTGNISANINKIDISLYAEFNIPDLTHPKNIDVSFSIGDNTYLVIEGILRNQDISDSINEMIHIFISRFVDFVNINQDLIERVLSSIIQSIVDGL
ncbi:uncharacterized protein LOC143200790 [Rhynchophorus ferrugineus]|uniref:uncharacterized protein LOC143200790 n=1 Tax=Rhynchophorus ferrugineus TaxID=354439 RepID=UPI003FCD56CE